MLVVGDNEVTENGVNVRKYGEQKSETIALDAFVDMIKVEGKEKAAVYRGFLCNILERN